MLHFNSEEFSNRRKSVLEKLEKNKLDAVLLFAPESQYWLTGYDTFGFSFFQCMVVTPEQTILLTRSADLRQAELTSNLKDIRIWVDGINAQPWQDLKDLLVSLGLQNASIGWETRTHGLTAYNGSQIQNTLDGIVKLQDCSDWMNRLRLVKSQAELAYVHKAAELSDLALDAGLDVIKSGADESDILNAMQGRVFTGGGDYAGNEFIIGSGDHALLCRYQSGRRILEQNDQITLEWSGCYRHYHAPMMRTVVVGDPSPQHHALQDATEEALLACEDALRAGNPMDDVFQAHARVFDKRDHKKARLNACGYAVGASFAPIWLEDHMFFEGADTIMEENMVFFLHMILMDSETNTANCLGRSYVVTDGAPKSLSNHPLDLIIR